MVSNVNSKSVILVHVHEIPWMGIENSLFSFLKSGVYIVLRMDIWPFFVFKTQTKCHSYRTFFFLLTKNPPRGFQKICYHKKNKQIFNEICGEKKKDSFNNETLRTKQFFFVLLRIFFFFGFISRRCVFPEIGHCRKEFNLWNPNFAFLFVKMGFVVSRSQKTRARAK